MTTSLFKTNITPMSDTKHGKAGEQDERQGGSAAQKPAVIRIKLKDKEYRRLNEAARAQNCTPEELVARCVQNLLET